MKTNFQEITLNPLLSSPLGLFISGPFEGGLIETGGLFNSDKTMVSVLHKELEYKVEKLKNKKVGGQAAADQNQIPTSSWGINHPGSVHTKFYSRD